MSESDYSRWDRPSILIAGEPRVFMIRHPKRVEWTPQPDITTYELAQCVPVLILGSNAHTFAYVEDNIPAGCERHFKIGDEQ